MCEVRFDLPRYFDSIKCCVVQKMKVFLFFFLKLSTSAAMMFVTCGALGGTFFG